MQRKYVTKYRDSIDLVEPIAIGSLRPFRFTVREQVAGIEDLMGSIRNVGLLQPIIVRPVPGFFEVVAGHRRLEACRRLRWKQIPAIVKELSDRAAYEICISENVQRNTLNPIEEAKAFKAYVEEQKWGSISELARGIGKSEPYVSHRILLLKLPEQVLGKISTGAISPSIGRELIWLERSDLQEQMAKIVENNELSVRETHKLARLAKSGLKTEDLIYFQKESVAEEKSEPDFAPRISKKRGAKQGVRESKTRSLDRTVLILRMTLIRLDEIIERCEYNDIKDFVMERRFAIHSMIDECVKTRKELELSCS
jgi:ParB family chromosome partitioning protein